MTNSDVFFNLLAQVLHEANGSAANSLKNLVGWPDSLLSVEKEKAVNLLKQAAVDDTIYEAWWNSDDF